MTDPRGFLTIQRRVVPYRPVDRRRADWADVNDAASTAIVREQARRCMDCGVPFCHTGCPLGNLIPDWNDLVERDRFADAIDRLHATNNFPEFTGKLCPAPCEEACVLTLNDDPVTIKQIEMAIIDRAFADGRVVPLPPRSETARSVAVIGSGPAGLTAAQQLRRAGHRVTVYERDDRLGGLLRYGIPDFKIGKDLVDRRLEQLRAEGVAFVTATAVEPGAVDADAVIVATGAQRHRDLALPGRELAGIEFAMRYLTACNRRVAGVAAEPIVAAGKRVVIIGGGDTSADCLGSAIREKAASVVEIAHGPHPPTVREPLRTWPEWPRLLRTYAAHLEGGDRRFGLEPTAFEGRNGSVSGVRLRPVEFPRYDGIGRRPAPVVTAEEFVLEAELVLLAVGFHHDPPSATLENVFPAGDCVLGADLVVTAIAEGRRAAAEAGAYLARL